MKYIFAILLSLFFMSNISAQTTSKPKDFVTVEGTQFKVDGQAYRFVGTNFWYGPQMGLPENQERLIKELDQLAAMGVNNLRIMVSSEGPDSEPYRVTPSLMPNAYEYNEALLDGLDFLLAEMQKRKIYGVLVLGDFWHWSGGFGQLLNWVNGKGIPYPSFDGGVSWGIYMDFTYKFYANMRAKKIYWDIVRKLVGRTNQITKQAYKDNPTIMAWQLANEPKCGLRKKAYRQWIRNTAKLIKELDPNHLISTGSEGTASENLFGNRRRNFIKNHSKYIDYLTVHIWIQNWMWYDPNKPKTLIPAQEKAIKYLKKHVDIAKEMQMPLVLEEFGIARDQESYDANSAVTQRDAYYTFMFDFINKNIKEGSPLQGCNFWAWGGLGRPRVPKSVWKTGDDLIGDPPHEYQGWYSVYDTDSTTHAIIKAFNQKFND